MEFIKPYLPYIFALGTALCWGLYGPTLGKARIYDPESTPFKAYLGIGFAYLVIAIAGAIVVMLVIGKDKWAYTPSVPWGFGAGLLGAFGALFLTLSMYSGGARIPHAVMPVVFGGAVTITAVFTIVASRGALHGSPMLWVGIIGMGISAVIVARNTPHAHPPKKPVEPAHVSAEESAETQAVATTDHR